MGLTNLRPDAGKVSRRALKFEKKKLFYENVKSVVGSLAAKKTISKKKRTRSKQKQLKAYDLSSLTDVLPNVDAQSPQPDAAKRKLNCKSRKKLVERENNQLQAVLGHPAFQLDPVSAIQQHLERTQPPAVNQVKHRKDKKLTMKKQRPSSGKQSMEI
uniref:Putative ribosome biogenesis protein slx9-like n=1 Tax=Anthurium amnicola TaxID=1678845 RepID=A0A1D1XSX1_9ARAE